MISLFHLFKLRGHTILSGDGDVSSHSALVETYRYYVRNTFLFAFALCSLRQAFGPPIICQAFDVDLSQEYVDTKCYINGTTTTDEDGVVHHHHQYYQWIPLALLLHAVAYQLPYSFWIRRYGRRLKHCTHLPQKYCRLYPVDVEKKLELMDLVREIARVKGHGLFTKTVLLEVGYLAVTIAQLVLANEFFNRQLSLFDWNGAISRTFPLIGRCEIDYFNGGAQTQGRIACLLPLNALYAKLYFFIFLLTSITLACHAIVMLLRLRSYHLRHADERWLAGILMEGISNESLALEVLKVLDQCLTRTEGCQRRTTQV